MKTKLLLTACAAALVLGAPAYAAGNKSTVTQSGARNSTSVTQNSTSTTTGSTSTVTQSGSSVAPAKTVATVVQGENDVSTISQSAGGGDTASVTQAGLVGGFSSVIQTGGNNVATVDQRDDGNGGTGFAPKATSSSITQSGSGFALVTQNYSIIPADAFSPQTVSVIEQTGENSATVLQLDLGQDSTIRQGNGLNTAFVTQGNGVLSPGGSTVDGNFSDIDQLLATNGYAEVQQTNGGSSTITQTGDSSDAFVTQLGNGTAGNSSTVTQNNLGLASVRQFGGGNTSTITQDAGIYTLGLGSFPINADGKDYASVADLEQSGDSNSATIGQSGNSNLAVVTQNGLTGTTNTNVADISQTGDLTTVDLTQNQSGNSFTSKQGGVASTAIVTQTAGLAPDDINNVQLEQGLNGGVGALAQIDQTNGFNFASVKQTGDFTGNVPGPFGPLRRANAVYIAQTTSGDDVNQLSVDQSGTDNLFDVTQAGGGVIDGFTQSGTRNAFDLGQATADAGTQLTVTASSQTGTDNVIQGTQTGGDSSLTFTQAGTGNASLFTQTGTGNSATFTQDGSFNTIDVTQIGNDNTSTVTQNALSSGNTATVNQLANNGTSDVTQSDTGNSATVFQYTDFATSTITQSGTGNDAFVSQGQSPNNQ